MGSIKKLFEHKSAIDDKHAQTPFNPKPLIQYFINLNVRQSAPWESV